VIISASRRTDIPAFYSEWFINRIRAGFCAVPNPFNRNQISKISLLPKDVDAIVFWTRNPRPLFPYLSELDQSGYHYYFQYTLVDNPKAVDANSPKLDYSIRTFQELSQKVGPERVIWRYDPIVLSNQTDVAYHRDKYSRIAEQLSDSTRRSVISIMDAYPKASKRLREMTAADIRLMPPQEMPAAIQELIPYLVSVASVRGLEILSCSEIFDLTRFGVLPGKCIDDDYISRIFGATVQLKKDPNPRTDCGCVMSKAIGMYDSCIFGCQYCYATNSFERARQNHETHDSRSPSLLGWHEPNREDGVTTVVRNSPKQYSLWDTEGEDNGSREKGS